MSVTILARLVLCALLVAPLLACDSIASPAAVKRVGNSYKVAASCGTITWYPGYCMDTFDSDQRQLVAAVERTCQMGANYFGSARSISGYSVHGQVNPGKTSGEPAYNGLWIKPDQVVYRCGHARVFAHEITAHAWNMGCAAEGPHGDC